MPVEVVTSDQHNEQPGKVACRSGTGIPVVPLWVAHRHRTVPTARGAGPYGVSQGFGIAVGRPVGSLPGSLFW